MGEDFHLVCKSYSILPFLHRATRKLAFYPWMIAFLLFSLLYYFSSLTFVQKVWFIIEENCCLDLNSFNPWFELVLLVGSVCLILKNR